MKRTIFKPISATGSSPVRADGTSGRAPCALLLTLLTAVCGAAWAQPADPDATDGTRALFARLDQLRAAHLLFGHQHTTAYGIGWKAADTGDSDVLRTTGTFPAIHGWDFFSPRETAADRGAASMHAHAMAAHARGGINEFCWHAGNPVTGGNFYDTTPAVPALLPGGDRHAAFCADLDAIAAFFHDLRGECGEAVPVVFRPWHEHNGDWFWWGTPRHCAPETLAALWRFTVDYLRKEKDVHNVLYAWSPNWSPKDDYFLGYPGDEYVDIFGLDVYAESLAPRIPAIRALVERAEARGKIPALTEGGYPGGLSACAAPDFFTRHLLAPLRDDPVARRVAWVLLWRNANDSHFWVPPPGHPLADDFRAFHRDPFTVFCDTLPALPAGDGPAPPD